MLLCALVLLHCSPIPPGMSCVVVHGMWRGRQQEHNPPLATRILPCSLQGRSPGKAWVRTIHDKGVAKCAHGPSREDVAHWLNEGAAKYQNRAMKGRTVVEQCRDSDKWQSQLTCQDRSQKLRAFLTELVLLPALGRGYHAEPYKCCGSTVSRNTPGSYNLQQLQFLYL